MNTDTDAVTRMLKRAIDLLDTALGDSDPMIDDDMPQEEIEAAYPVMCSMQILTNLLTIQCTPTAPAQSCGDCHDGECYVDGSENCILRVAAQSCGDAYAGAREDLAIWKKRALEAEALNRKFMDEINGLTHMGEPHLSCGDAEQADEAVTDATERMKALWGVLMCQVIETSSESYLSLRCVGMPPTDDEFALAVNRAIDAELAKDSK